MKRTILGITAHADDHVMFAGTVMKLQKRGYQYCELVMTTSGEGRDFRDSKATNKTEKIAKYRKSELSAALKVLKCTNLYELHQEDQDLQYSKELMHQVMRIIRLEKPEIVFTMNTFDVHPDHCATAHIAREAIRWAAKNFRSEYGAPHRVTMPLYAEGTVPVDPHVLVDITDYYDVKEKLFKVYTSQATPRDLDLLKSTSLIRGYHLRKQEGVHAEAFTVEKNSLPILFE